jgi:hypothetical protein
MGIRVQSVLYFYFFWELRVIGKHGRKDIGQNRLFWGNEGPKNDVRSMVVWNNAKPNKVMFQKQPQSCVCWFFISKKPPIFFVECIFKTLTRMIFLPMEVS